MKKILLFLLICISSGVVFANFDQVNNQSCGCGIYTFAVGWTPISPVKECYGTKGQNQSGTQTWSCHNNNDMNCHNPSCSYGSSCAAHQSGCSCTPYGGAFWVSYTDCRPRFTCLATPSVSLAHAHPVSPAELPPSYTLTQNYYYSIVTPAVDTANKCEYTCDM